MQTIPATPKKLRNGTWGAIASTEQVSRGDTLTITTRAGKSWTATVEQVIWRGDGVAICATASAPRSGGRSAVRGVDYCGYPCPVSGRRCTASDPCHDCE